MRLYRLLVPALLSACAPAALPKPPEAAPSPPSAAAPAPMTLDQAGIVSAWLDRKVDPCSDFYDFACGGFLATAQIPPDRASWGTIGLVDEETLVLLIDILEKAAKDPGQDPVLRKIGDYYAACMDEPASESAGLAGLKEVFDAIATVKDLKSAVPVLADLHEIDVTPFFDLSPSQDFVDATQVIGALDQDGIGLPERKYYLEKDEKLQATRNKYREHLQRLFLLSGLPEKEAEVATSDTMRVETAIAKLQQDQVVRRDPHNVYHRIDRAGLEKAAPSFPWQAYFARRKLENLTAITVHDPAYYGAIAALIAAEKPAAIRHYLISQVLSDLSEELTPAFAAEDFALDQLLYGADTIKARNRRCVERVDRDLGELLAQPWVALKFSPQDKLAATDLTRATLDAMRSELDILPWMDGVTRKAAHEKLGTMSYLIGYPEHYRVYDFPVSRKSHLDNVLAATRFEVRRQLAKIGKPVDPSEWQMTPPTVNAYYDPSLNQLVLPAGQLQPPFFAARFHPAVNFGATGGGTIGHEMTHAFDDEGSQFDAHGNLRDWWTPHTSEAFEAATQCVVDQFANYEAVPGVKLDGKLTAGENIADIGGVKLAFRAYEVFREKNPVPREVSGMSDEQLYYLSYAQSWCTKMKPEALATMAFSNPHSPPRFRVNGVVVNQPGFAAAFHCKKAAPMAPEHMCAVW